MFGEEHTHWDEDASCFERYSCGTSNTSCRITIQTHSVQGHRDPFIQTWKHIRRRGDKNWHESLLMIHYLTDTNVLWSLSLYRKCFRSGTFNLNYLFSRCSHSMYGPAGSGYQQLRDRQRPFMLLEVTSWTLEPGSKSVCRTLWILPREYHYLHNDLSSNFRSQ